jgi:putative membrane protein
MMKNGLVWVLLVILLVLLFFSIADQGHMWGGGMGFGHGGGYVWIILVILAGVVVYLMMQSKRFKTDGDGETPLDILKKRFARGEITEEQYEEMKKKLEE